MVAALEFGLPELQAHCLEKLANSITADTVCTTLLLARSSLGNIIADKNNAVHEVEECCMKFIEANTCAVFKSKGFLKLQKDTLLTIIQSIKVSMDLIRGVNIRGNAAEWSREALLCTGGKAPKWEGLVGQWKQRNRLQTHAHSQGPSIDHSCLHPCYATAKLTQVVNLANVLIQSVFCG